MTAPTPNRRVTFDGIAFDGKLDVQVYPPWVINWNDETIVLVGSAREVTKIRSPRRHLSEQLESRLVNWKFSQALRCAEEDGIEADSQTFEIIASLAETFGDCGHFEGAMGTVVLGAVCSLVGYT